MKGIGRPWIFQFLFHQGFGLQNTARILKDRAKYIGSRMNTHIDNSSPLSANANNEKKSLAPI